MPRGHWNGVDADSRAFSTVWSAASAVTLTTAAFSVAAGVATQGSAARAAADGMRRVGWVLWVVLLAVQPRLGSAMYLHFCESDSECTSWCGSNAYCPDVCRSGSTGNPCDEPPDCVAGKFRPSGKDLGGNVARTSCPAGKISDSPGVSDCRDCSPGTFSAAGASSCSGSACATGKFGPKGAVSSSTATCASCEAGKYSSLPSATKCTDCSSGTFSAADASTCSGWPIACDARDRDQLRRHAWLHAPRGLP